MSDSIQAAAPSLPPHVQLVQMGTAGAVPAGGFGSVPSLRALGYKPFYDKLNVAAIGCGASFGFLVVGVISGIAGSARARMPSRTARRSRHESPECAHGAPIT